MARDPPGPVAGRPQPQKPEQSKLEPLFQPPKVEDLNTPEKVIVPVFLILAVCCSIVFLDTEKNAARIIATGWMNATTFFYERLLWIWSYASDNMFIIQSLSTCVALLWLLHRAWNVLWKPVNELISILGVEVPDAPEVSLAGIKHNSITLHWSRPGPQRPVVKYLIQVNGVNVGESSRLETAIEVTGLRPGHFYNVRVIAVGSNNFQAGSRVIRLRTKGRDGRPLPNTAIAPENTDSQESASEDEASGGRKSIVGVQATALPESQAMTREPSGNQAGQRRNTVGRKHSPSIVGAVQTQKAHVIPDQPEESMYELTTKFELIRREIDAAVSQHQKYLAEFSQQQQALECERDQKIQALKEKQEASEQLQADVKNFGMLNRHAQNRKAAKEKILKEKESAKKKMLDEMEKWRQEIDEMKKQEATWQSERKYMEERNKADVEQLQSETRKLQTLSEQLDGDIHAKGIEIKNLEDERKKLIGDEDNDESQAREAKEKKEEAEWSEKERQWLSKLNGYAQQVQEIESITRQKQNQLTLLQSNPMVWASTTGVEFEPTGVQNRVKSRNARSRSSRTNTISSPISAFPIADSPFPSAAAYNNLNATSPNNFVQGPYMRHHLGMVQTELHGMSEEQISALTGNAPLSPQTAHSLLPSSLLDEDPIFAEQHAGAYDPQSPHSSSRSASIFSSPQNSSHNLAMYGVSGHDYAEADRRSTTSPRAQYGAIGSPVVEDSVPHKIREVFSLSRMRGKTMQGDGPSLGSLKPGQSQSLPRSNDEPEPKQRRTSLSTSWTTLLRKAPTAEAASEGNAPALARNPNARARRGFNMFSNSLDDPSIKSDRDPSSPRPLSVASSDFPRPSTDSAPFGWSLPQDSAANRASPLATNWSLNATQTWSRNPSRRPSIQHGSTTALGSGVADEDDEFLPPSDPYQSSPSAGVIGTRPPSSHKPVTPKLNPTAPVFFGFGRSKNKGKSIEVPPVDDSPEKSHVSPPASRGSRDTQSIHTLGSMAESHESLDRVPSNTASDKLAGTTKESSAFKQLFRKSSSSKFSSLRNKDSFFRKAGSSTASDRNASVERDGSFDAYGEEKFGRSVDSVTSSPMIGSTSSGDWNTKNKDKDPGTPKEGKTSGVNWSRLGFKKNKTRESLDVDRSEAETTGTEDEG